MTYFLHRAPSIILTCDPRIHGAGFARGWRARVGRTR